MLTPAERALLFRACWNHPVAKCEGCRGSFKTNALVARHLCPSCRIDLTHSIRDHLIACSVAAVLDARHVAAQAKAVREANNELRKKAQQLRDASAVARAESEATRQMRPGAQIPPDVDAQ